MRNVGHLTSWVTHYWGRSLKGNWVVKRKTISKRLSSKIQGIGKWCRDNRHLPIFGSEKASEVGLRGSFSSLGVWYFPEFVECLIKTKDSRESFASAKGSFGVSEAETSWKNIQSSLHKKQSGCKSLPRYCATRKGINPTRCLMFRDLWGE